MKISFSQGKKSMVPMVGREVAKLHGLWSGSPVAPHHPVGSLAWGASLWGDPGSGCKGVCGCKHSLWGWITAPPPSSYLEGDAPCCPLCCSLLTFVLFPVQLPRTPVICNPFRGAAL